MTFQPKSCVWVLLLAFLGCTSKRIDGKEELKPGSAGTVQVAIWSNYLTQETIDAFEKKTGYRVSLSHYGSNEELLAKLQGGATGYDVALPSDYMVKILASLGLLVEIDRAKIRNFSKIEPGLLGKPFDPENRYSLPYGWGTTGIAVRRDLYKGKLTGWKDLFGKDGPKGFSLLDDGREVIGAALKAQGLSLNTRKPEDLAAAKTLLLSARKRIKAFASEVITAVVSGDLPVAQMYSVDALQARARVGDALEYLLPAEGGTFWIDHFVLPKGGRNPAGAHALLDFLTDPAQVAALVAKRYAGPVLPDVKEHLPKDFVFPAVLTLSRIPMQKFELIEDLGADTAAWDRVWTEVKTGSE